MCCVFCDERLVVFRVFNASWSIAWSRSYCVSSTQQAAPSPPSWWSLLAGLSLLWFSASGTYFPLVTNRHGASTGCGRPGPLPVAGSVWVVYPEQVQLGPFLWAGNNRCSTEVINTIKTKCYTDMKHYLHLVIKLCCITVIINNAWILITHSHLPAGKQHVFLAESKKCSAQVKFCAASRICDWPWSREAGRPGEAAWVTVSCCMTNLHSCNTARGETQPAPCSTVATHSWLRRHQGQFMDSFSAESTVLLPGRRSSVTALFSP